mgnify:FL=1
MADKLVKPLGDRVLLKESQKEEKTASGIIIPDTVMKEDVKTAKVVSVGPGLFTQSGTLIPMNVQVGDEVILPPYNQGQEIKLNGEKYILLRESEILMVIK